MHMCFFFYVTNCKLQLQTWHILQKSTPWCVTVLCGCFFNVAGSKQSRNSRRTQCVVTLCFLFLSVGEVVTGFYGFHLWPSLLAMCESSKESQGLFIFKAQDATYKHTTLDCKFCLSSVQSCLSSNSCKSKQITLTIIVKLQMMYKIKTYMQTTLTCKSAVVIVSGMLQTHVL